MIYCHGITTTDIFLITAPSFDELLSVKFANVVSLIRLGFNLMKNLIRTSIITLQKMLRSVRSWKRRKGRQVQSYTPIKLKITAWQIVRYVRLFKTTSTNSIWRPSNSMQHPLSLPLMDGSIICSKLSLQCHYWNILAIFALLYIIQSSCERSML